MSRRPLPLSIAGALLALLGIAFAIESVRLGLWADGMPGAGLLPLLAACLLVALALFLGVKGGLVPDEEHTLDRVPLKAIALLLAFAWLVPLAGFVPATVLMITLWTHYFHQQGWWRSAFLGIVLVAAGVVLFRVALSVPMPLFPEFN